jgi:tetratricopeptide (TPR) repeat protein
MSFSAQEQRLALLIGNSNYTHGGSLPNPVNDVRAMAKVLEGLGFTVMKYEDCSQKNMKQAMDKFGRKLKGKNVGLFFYSGHGFQVNGYNYLLPIDAKLESEHDAEYDCVRAGRILAKMEAAGSKTNIVILDACRDNPFTRSWRRGTEGSGLAFMNAPSGSLIAYSTAPGKTALDGRGINSPYTSALLKNIDTPNITVLQMFQRVRSTVMKQSDKKQIPWESTSLRGDFYFNENEEINEETKEDKTTIRTIHFEDLFTKKEIQEMKKKEEQKKRKIQNIVKAYTKSIKLNPEDVNSYLGRGFAYFENKLYTKAIQDFTKAIELNPNHVNAYMLRSLSYHNLKKYKKKMQDLTQAIELNSDSVKDDSPTCVKGYLQLIERNKNDVDIAKRITQIIELKPRKYFLFYVRAWGYINLKQYEKAVSDLTKAIELSSNDDDLYIARAEAYRNLKQYTKAIQDYSKAIELKTKDIQAYRNRASCYRELQQNQKAIRDYTRIIELKPNSRWAYEIRVRWYRELKQHSKAIQDYKKIIELTAKDSPQEWLANAGLATYYFELKQYDSAIQAFTKLIELNPKSSHGYSWRGNTYLNLKQYAKAIQDYTRSIELDPKHIEAYYNRGVCYSTLHRSSQACADANKACDLGNCQLLEDFVKEGRCN